MIEIALKLLRLEQALDGQGQLRRLMPRRGVPGESPGRLGRSRPGLRAADR